MIVIDEQLTGWKNKHEKELSGKFGEIRAVGEHVGLPKGIKDQALASYCKEQGSSLLTCDRTVYSDFFVQAEDIIWIRLFGRNEDSTQNIYEVRISGSK